MPKKLSVLLFIAFFSIIIVASVCKAEELDYQDSLKIEIKALCDSAKSIYGRGIFDSGIVLSQKAMELANQMTESKDSVMAVVNLTLAMGYSQNGELDKGEDALYRALNAYNRTDKSAKNLSAAINTALGNNYYALKKFKEAEIYFGKAYETLKNIDPPDSTNIGLTMMNLALVYRYLNRFEESEKFFTESRQILVKMIGPDHPLIGNNYNNHAILVKSQGDFARAAELQEKALEIKIKNFGENNVAVGKSLMNLANIYDNIGRYDGLEEMYSRAIDILENTLGEKHPHIVLAIYNLSNLKTKLGKTAEAESLAVAALEMAEEIYEPDHPFVALSMHRLGDVYFRQGRYSESARLENDALEIRKKALGEESEEVSESLNALSRIYRIQGEYEKAESLLVDALYISRKIFGDRHYHTAADLENLAIILKYQNKYNKADSLLKLALDINKEIYGDNNYKTAITILNLAQNYQAIGEYTEAESYANSALNIIVNAYGESGPLAIESYQTLGDIYLQQNKFVEAQHFAQKAYGFFKRTLGLQHPLMAESALLLGQIYAGMGHYDSCLTYYDTFVKSRNMFIDQVFSYSSTEQKLRWADRYPAIDKSLINIASETGHQDITNLAAEMILQGKAAVIDAIMTEKRTAFCARDDELMELIETRNDLGTKIANRVLAGLGQEDPSGRSDSLQILYTSLDSIEAEISRRCSAYSEVGKHERLLDKVSSRLSGNEVLLEFIRHADNNNHQIYSLFVLRRDTDPEIRYIGKAGVIDSLVYGVRRMLYDAGSLLNSPRIIFHEKELQEILSQLNNRILYFSEIADSNIDNVIIAPDGSLNLIPFEILYNDDLNRYIIEDYTISYLSSGRDILQMHYDGKPAGEIIMVANPDYNNESTGQSDKRTVARTFMISHSQTLNRGGNCFSNTFTPLRYAVQEISSIKNAFLDNSDLFISEYTGPDASEELLKYIVEPPAILHLATHGVFCESDINSDDNIYRNPLLRAGLALSGANRNNYSGDKFSDFEDGILTAFEVSGINLIGTRLTALSACETGLGEISAGEGVFGFRRAFQNAGSESILMSLWNVPDKETCSLMEYFYTGWMDDSSKRKALRNASLKLMHTTEQVYGHSHPYIWGGFVLLGNFY